jgi:hypothetical protein
MLDIIQAWRTKNMLKKQLLSFLDEMEKNLEIYYVADQRQFITSAFILDMWDKVKELDIIKKYEELKVYSTVLLDFNKSYEEYKSYEKWYSSDIQNRNNENAKKLHELKNQLNRKLGQLESIIILAGQALEKELLKLGFVSN